MSSFDFDSLKAEKADAIRRFNRKKNLTSSIQLIGAFSLFLYSYIIIIIIIIKFLSPITLTTTSQQFYPFVLINTIIFLIYQSSTTKTPENNQSDAAAAASQPDLYDEYVSFSSCRPETTTTTCDGYGLQLVDLSPVGPEEEIPTSSSSSDQEEDGMCKDLIVSDNAVDFSENHSTNPVRDVVVVDNYDDAVKSDGRRLRRSWSEKGCGAGRGGVGKVLRRSETGNGREVVAVNGGRKSVQEMDNEEFKMAIEKFIANKKKILRDENIALLTTVEEKDHV